MIIALVACNSVLALAVLPMTPLAVDAGAARLADHALLNSVSVAGFDVNLTGGATSSNTTLYLPLNKSAVVTAAAVNLTGKPDLSYVTLLGGGNSWDSGEDFGHALTSADWNNDGYADVAVGWGGYSGSTAGPGRVEVYYGGPQKIVPGRQNWTGLDGTGIAGFGGALAYGDYNHDGVEDLVVGEAWPVFAGSPHRVWVYNGSGAGLPSNASYNISLGPSNTTLFGSALAGGIDLNGDGFDDLVVGEQDFNAGAGRAVIVWGGGAGLNISNSTSLQVANTTGFGEVLKSLGDTDGDGLGEFAVGLYRDAGQFGRVMVFEGTANSTAVQQRFSYAPAAMEGLGYSVAGGRDVTGDGIPDLAVGAPFKNTNGGVYVFPGSGNATYSAAANVTLPALSGTQENLGIGLDIVRDMDGDGKADLIAGGNRWGYNATQPWDGRFYLYPGTNLSADAAWTFDNPNVGHTDELGWRVHALGDLNNDGVDEFAISVHSGVNGTATSGLVRLYYGSAHAYPENTTVFVGASQAYKAPGTLRGNLTAAGWAPAIQAYLTANQASANGNGDILVPISFNFSAGGRLNVSQITVRYSVVLSPANVSAVAPSDGTSVVVSWSLQNSDGNLYSVWSNKSGSWAILGNVSFPRTFFNDTSITNGARYYYYVTEWDTSVPLQSPPSPIVSAVPLDTLPPNRPVNLTLQKNDTAHSIALRWTPNSDDTVRYEIWRQDGDLAAFAIIANVTAPTSAYDDAALSEEVNYTYEVRAVDDVGLLSPYSLPATERIPDLTPPATPANFNAVTNASGTAADLSWTDNTGDTVAYIIFRSATGAAGSFGEVARAPQSPFTFGGLTRGATSYFEVVALDKADLRSPPTPSVAVFTVDTLPPDAPVLTGAAPLAAGNSVLLNWTATGDDIGLFRIYTDRSGSWQAEAEAAANARSVVIDNLTDGALTSFRITGVDRGNLEGAPSNVLTATPSDTQRPGAPTGLSVTAPTSGKALIVQWSAPPDNDVVGYHVFYVDPALGVDWRPLGTVTGGLSYTATGLKNGLSYRFEVSAYDEVPNEGPPSQFASGTPADLVPPSPPVITTESVATVLVNLAVAGRAEPGMQVQIWVRDTLQSTEDVDATGNWTGTMRLVAGDNAVYAIAVDPDPIVASTAKTSEKSQTVHFTLDTVRPTATTTSPTAGAADVSLNASVIITFSEEVRAASVVLTLTDAAGKTVAGKLQVDVFNHTARFTPDAPLAPGTQYTAHVEATDAAGNTMTPQTVTFTTAAAGGPGGGKAPGFEPALAAAALGLAAVAVSRRRRPGQHR